MKTRYPVCASGSRTDMIVICTDGSAWQLIVNINGAAWSELPPIPGTERDNMERGKEAEG